MTIQQQITTQVLQEGHWGVVRGILTTQMFDNMADMVGMAGGYSSRFRNIYFADGVTRLNERAMTALAQYLEMDRSDLELINERLEAHQTEPRRAVGTKGDESFTPQA